MPGIRELLAVVLGVLLGVLLVAAPKAMLRASVFVSPTRRRRHDGPYGEDGFSISEKWLWVVRALGVACIAIAGVIAYQSYA